MCFGPKNLLPKGFLQHKICTCEPVLYIKKAQSGLAPRRPQTRTRAKVYSSMSHSSVNIGLCGPSPSEKYLLHTCIPQLCPSTWNAGCTIDRVKLSCKSLYLCYYKKVPWALLHVLFSTQPPTLVLRPCLKKKVPDMPLYNEFRLILCICLIYFNGFFTPTIF